MVKKDERRRRIPAVDQILERLGESVVPHALRVRIIRSELAALRQREVIPDAERIVESLRLKMVQTERMRMQPVINATGVVVHTNLGRAPLGADVLEVVRFAGGRYSNLELDLNSGGRGSRGGYVEQCLAILCRAESATVVNNCAAALVLLLRHCTARKKEVVISRGELVQIGGGFRIPDILETSGACLKEVGTTNRTTLSDYARALGPKTGLILKVHRSNFFMGGFVEAPSTSEIAALARKKRVPFVEDLGSGALFRTESIEGLEHEPTPAEVLRAGADLVCFSGDKLMGGPQAGIIAGREKHVRALKKDPFFRALRCDKLILSALQATAELALNDTSGDGGAGGFTVAHELLAADLRQLRRRAARLDRTLRPLPVDIRVVTSRAQVGGGTLPRSELDSMALSLKSGRLSARELADRLRIGDPPIIGTVTRGRVQLDLRTVFPEQDRMILESLRKILLPE